MGLRLCTEEHDIPAFCMHRVCHRIANHTNILALVLMNDQAGKLSDLIKDRCAAAHARKKQLRMLANTEKLQFYRKKLSSFSARFSDILCKDFFSCQSHVL